MRLKNTIYLCEPFLQKELSGKDGSYGETNPRQLHHGSSILAYLEPIVCLDPRIM